MTKRYRGLSGAPNGGTVQVAGENVQVDGRFAEVRKTVAVLWPRPKTAVNLALYADVTVRQAEKLLAGHQGFSGAVLTRMLRGDHGLVLLRALMGDANPEWWREFELERAITEKKRTRRGLDRELDALEQRRAG